jgi:hypothetical protein
MKKAQGISLEVIIIAALGLLVLVVLSIIFAGRSGMFVSQSDKCETKYRGTCVATQDECAGQLQKVATDATCDLNGDQKFNFNNKDGDGWCCITVG